MQMSLERVPGEGRAACGSLTLGEPEERRFGFGLHGVLQPDGYMGEDGEERGGQAAGLCMG